jgi:hypothetical protein
MKLYDPSAMPSPGRPVSVASGRIPAWPWIPKVVLVAVLLSILVATFPATAGPNFLLVAHEDVPGVSIDQNTAAKAFLHRGARWDNGLPIRPVTLATQEVREEFARVIHGKTDLELRKHWQRQVFTGRSSPPLERPNDEAVLDYVRHTPGAIGFVSLDAEPAGVKILHLH